MGCWNRTRRTSQVLSVLILLGTVGASSQVVVPNFLTDVEGNFDNSIPWDDEAPVRYQQVFLGTEVGPIVELQQIRFRHFLRDSRAIEREPSVLHQRVAAEKSRLRQFLEAQCRDIEENDDSKIKRFRKKRKIIVHPEAAKDLI